MVTRQADKAKSNIAGKLSPPCKTEGYCLIVKASWTEILYAYAPL